MDTLHIILSKLLTLFRLMISRIIRVTCRRFRRNSNASSASNWGTSGAAVSAASRTATTAGLRRCGPPRCPSGREDTRRGARTGRRRTWTTRRRGGTSWKCSCASLARSRWSSAAADRTSKNSVCRWRRSGRARGHVIYCLLLMCVRGSRYGPGARIGKTQRWRRKRVWKKTVCPTVYSLMRIGYESNLRFLDLFSAPFDIFVFWIVMKLSVLLFKRYYSSSLWRHFG